MTDLFNVDIVDNLDLDPNEDYLSKLTGPGGKFDKTKYKTEQEAYQAMARAKAESDSYIEIMKRRMDEMRTDLNKRDEEATAKVKLQELIDRLEKTKQPSEENNQMNKDDDKPLYDPKSVEDLIVSKIRETETQKREAINFETVMGKLKERYGAKYPAVLEEQISELGLTKDAVNSMARTMPQVLIRTLGLDQEPQRDVFSGAPRSSVRSDNFLPKGGEKRDYAYYQALKKTDPERYRDPKTTVQMHKDAAALGEREFYGPYYEEQ